MEEWVIAHAGVKGMRHGERRYQNPDGTWTELGKARRRDAYGDTGRKNMHGATPVSGHKKRSGPTLTLKQRVQKAKAASAKKKQTKEQEKLDRERALEDAEKRKIIDSGDPKLLEENKHRLSNSEIDEALARIDRYNRASAALAAREGKQKRSRVDALINAGEKVKKLLDIWNSDSIKAITGRQEEKPKDRKLFGSMDELFEHRGEMTAKEFSDMYKAMQSAEHIRPAERPIEEVVRERQRDLQIQNAGRERQGRLRYSSKLSDEEKQNAEPVTPHGKKTKENRGKNDYRRVIGGKNGRKIRGFDLKNF